MGRKSEKSKTAAAAAPTAAPQSNLFAGVEKQVDSALDSLFQSSAGPVIRPKRQPVGAPRQDKATPPPSSSDEEDEDEDEDEVDGVEGAAEEDDSSDAEEDQDEEDSEAEEDVPVAKSKPSKKRKRGDAEDDLEDRYMKKLAAEEAREQKVNSKVKGLGSDSEEEVSDAEATPGAGAADEADDSDGDDAVIQHESVTKTDKNTEVEKASRTVFLGNVSTTAISSKSSKKELMKHISSHLDSLPAHNPPHKLESIRFRSTAFTGKLPKKAAFIQRELMDATTKSTNAYAVYSTKKAALEAAKWLNGTVILDRHLRVDSVAHPAKTDHKRCIFVGNLDFVDDDTQIREDKNDNKKTKPRAPADVEEGLWVEFGKIGSVESVRVIRDAQTRVGKGFAYVQFTDEISVEAALLHNDKKFPPLLPRKIRVMRAKSIKRNNPSHPSRSSDTHNANGPPNRTSNGRAGKLFGKAGAAQARKQESRDRKRQRKGEYIGPGKGSSGDGAAKAPKEFRRPEDFIFEGHRATKNDTTGLRHGGKKNKGKGKPVGKPQNRTTKRTEAWRKNQTS